MKISFNILLRNKVLWLSNFCQIILMFDILIIFFDFFQFKKYVYTQIFGEKKSAQSAMLLQYNFNIGTHGTAIWFQDFPCTSVGIFIQLSLSQSYHFPLPWACLQSSSYASSIGTFHVLDQSIPSSIDMKGC